ncbi:zinc transporter 8-like [Huso huso]|uniref:Proton-coupled zinc antiporter SLC30A8 n=1 Tax=Huso huso TaxID=61971 RepID=A0ABR1A1A9_HUSHU
MFKRDPERSKLVRDKQANMYSVTLGSMSIEDLEKAPCDKDGVLNNHCHVKNRASEDRKIEQKLAKQRLWIVSAVCMVFMIGEIVGGYIAGSLAVMTDAAHLLVDFASFMISLCSLWLSSRPATKRLNYGWHRAEILGALLSIFTIWLVTGVLVYLACERLISNNYTIDGTVMLITSGCAVLANIIMGLTLHQTGHGHSHVGGSSHGHGHSHGKRSMEESGHLPQDNASVRAAFIHVLGDLLQSFSVLISAIIIFFKPEYKIADPICTFLFSLFVLVTTFTILRDILLVLMEGAPIGIKYNAVRDRILMVKGVKAIHNMYIWALTMNQVVLSAHVVLDDTVNPQPALKEVTEACFDNFGFHSVTIQVEQQLDQNPDCAYCQDPKD